MSLFRQNVDLLPPLALSSWRKIAIGTWRSAGDPSVYGILELEAEAVLAYIERLRMESGERITLTHFVGRAMAETLKRHPQINSILRFGQLYPRRNVDIFFQVATDTEGEDLSGMTVRGADRKSTVEIAREMAERVALIRARRDTSFTKMKGIMDKLPGWLARWVIDATSILTYTFNLWTPLLGTPRDPFGSCMITNIGSLGMDMAFAPLVPYSRVPILIALGAARDTAVVRDGQIVVRKIIQMCVTLDHRLIDGVHGAKMARTMQAIFADPVRELG